jgi:hypothetical protein
MNVLLHFLLVLAPLALGSSHAVAGEVRGSTSCQRFQRPILTDVVASLYFRNQSALVRSIEEETSDFSNLNRRSSIFSVASR